MTLLFDNRVLTLTAQEVETLMTELFQCANYVRENPNQVQYNLVILARNIGDAFADANHQARAFEAADAHTS